jgi:hypothetical protein
MHNERALGGPVSRSKQMELQGLMQQLEARLKNTTRVPKREPRGCHT